MTAAPMLESDGMLRTGHVSLFRAEADGLIPKPKTKDFLRFLGVVVIIYLGVLASGAVLPSTGTDVWSLRLPHDVHTTCEGPIHTK